MQIFLRFFTLLCALSWRVKRAKFIMDHEPGDGGKGDFKDSSGRLLSLFPLESFVQWILPWGNRLQAMLSASGQNNSVDNSIELANI